MIEYVIYYIVINKIVFQQYGGFKIKMKCELVGKYVGIVFLNQNVC